MMEDLYEELGVPRHADEKAIRKAFRHKAKTMHPDRGGDASQFLKLQLAYSVLISQSKRKHSKIITQ